MKMAYIIFPRRSTDGSLTVRGFEIFRLSGILKSLLNRLPNRRLKSLGY